MNEFLIELFRHVCGQGDCPQTDGQALAVCWRCLGLYGGAAVTAAWLIASGLWRRGLPSWSVFIAQVLALIAAMLGGLHFINGPAAWKLTCGLWTGHVAVVWLIGGAQHLLLAGRRGQLPWRKGDKIASLFFLAALPALALALGTFVPSAPLLHVLDVAIVAGAMAIVASAAMAVMALAVAAARATRGRATDLAPDDSTPTNPKMISSDPPSLT